MKKALKSAKSLNRIIPLADALEEIHDIAVHHSTIPIDDAELKGKLYAVKQLSKILREKD